MGMIFPFPGVLMTEGYKAFSFENGARNERNSKAGKGFPGLLVLSNLGPLLRPC